MTVDPADLHRDCVVADAHNDLLLAVVGRPVERWRTYFATEWVPQLRDGGVDLQILPVFIDDWYRPEGALRQTLRMIECAHRIVTAEVGRICRTGVDIDATLADGQIAFVLALESAPGIGEDVELFETLHRLGVRVASLAHFGRTALADGSAEDAAGGRLTHAGVQAVSEIERLGMVLDVSHLGITGVAHALELSTRPVLATHSAARALLDHHRNLSDEQIAGIAATGGVVCVNCYGPYLDIIDRSIDRVVDHLEHLISIAGIEHVGLGPDFLQQVEAETLPACCEMTTETDAFVAGLQGPRGLPLLTAALVRRGWDEAAIRLTLGENLRRVLTTALPRC